MAFDWRFKEATAHSTTCAICACPATAEDAKIEALSRRAAQASPTIGFLGDSVSASEQRRACQPVGVLQCATCVVTCHRRCVATLSAVWGQRAVVSGFADRDASDVAKKSKTSRRIRARSQSGGVMASSAGTNAAAAWRCHLCRWEDRVDCSNEPPPAADCDEEDEDGGDGDEGSGEDASKGAAVPPTRAAKTDLTTRGAVIAGISLGSNVALNAARFGTVSAFRAAAASSGSGSSGGGEERTVVPTFEIKLEDGSTVEMAHEPLFKRLWENSQGGGAASAAVEASVEVEASAAPLAEAATAESATEAAAPEVAAVEAAAPDAAVEAAAVEAET